MKAHDFVHLHVHSQYSILDATGGVGAIVNAADRLGMSAIAITDHGNMFAAVDFYRRALRKGLKPIIGFEAYLTGGSRFEKGTSDDGHPLHHLVLLAKNIEGYINLVSLSTRSFTEGFHCKPRIDWELLETYHEGIIALGGCLHGEVPWKLAQGDEEGARKAVRRYQDVFGPEDFYLELQNHGLPEELDILPKIVATARSCSVPVVATNDCHYIDPDDWEGHDALLCMQTGSRLNDPNRLRFGSREYYLKSPQLMAGLFREIPDALSNTLRVAERCNVQLPAGMTALPRYPLPENETPDGCLERLCREALPRRYSGAVPEAAAARLAYELEVIKRSGFSDSFLVVRDVVGHARDAGIAIGPGRGSAPCSIVNYLLGITALDPIRHGLPFERFLDPERLSVPRIVIDIESEGYRTVITSVIGKYGRDKASEIVTFHRIHPSQALRVAGRLLGMQSSEIRAITGCATGKNFLGLPYIISHVPQLKDKQDNGTETQKRLLRIAKTLDGCIHRTGISPAGVVISREPLGELVPSFRTGNGRTIPQYDSQSLEHLGHVRFDILGLKTLSVIRRALETIRRTHGTDPDGILHGFDDRAVYDLLGRGLTTGVFQLESGGMRSLLKRFRPDTFGDIAALLALYRPGPLACGMADDIIECKHGRKSFGYLHPDLEPILRETYGVFLYQEQFMLAAQAIAAFTMSQANLLRKVLLKKIPQELGEQRGLFVDGAFGRGISLECAEDIFDQMEYSADVSFIKSHAASYAVMSYQTAWLKARYPAEYLEAMIGSGSGMNKTIDRYAEECRSLEHELPAGG